MSRFEEMCYKMNEKMHWGWSVMFAAIYTLLLLCYIECIENLEKPAKFKEALDFLFANPQDYIIALLVGVLLHILPWLLGMGVLFALVATFLFNEERKVTIYVINIVLTIIMVSLNANIVHYVGSLVLVAVCLGIGVWAVIDGSKR